MEIKYICCGVKKNMKHCKGYIKDKGCVVMCPICHSVMTTVFAFHPDGTEQQKEQGWIKQAKANGLYFD